MKKLLLLLSSYLIFIFWVDAQPTIQWQKAFGGTNADGAYFIDKTYDGGYIFAGTSLSANGDVTFHYGPASLTDFWVGKISSSGTLQWQKSLGGTKIDDAYCVKQTLDSGFIVCGNTASTDGVVSGNHGAAGTNDIWVVKLTSAGNIQWKYCYGGTDRDESRYIEQTADMSLPDFLLPMTEW